MKVYQTGAGGYYLNETFADPNPLEPGEWLIPGGCVTVAPPPTSTNEVARWWNGAWTVEVHSPVQQVNPLADDVNMVRDQRIVAGCVVRITGYGPVPVQGRAVDARNIESLANVAKHYISIGQASTITKFRDANNVVHDLTQPQIVELWLRAVSYVSAVYEAAWELKDTVPTPDDFALDIYWPASE